MQIKKMFAAFIPGFFGVLLVTHGATSAIILVLLSAVLAGSFFKQAQRTAKRKYARKYARKTVKRNSNKQNRQMNYGYEYPNQGNNQMNPEYVLNQIRQSGNFSNQRDNPFNQNDAPAWENTNSYGFQRQPENNMPSFQSPSFQSQNQNQSYGSNGLNFTPNQVQYNATRTGNVAIPKLGKRAPRANTKKMWYEV